jgi:hypothetical protein
VLLQPLYWVCWLVYRNTYTNKTLEARPTGLVLLLHQLNHLTMRTLYLAVVDTSVVATKWGIYKGSLHHANTISYTKESNAQVMVRCNAKGIINWEKTAIYSFHELVDKRVVFKQQGG